MHQPYAEATISSDSRLSVGTIKREAPVLIGCTREAKSGMHDVRVVSRIVWKTGFFHFWNMSALYKMWVLTGCVSEVFILYSKLGVVTDANHAESKIENRL